MIKFPRGSVVPRWLNVKTSQRKAQHNLKFGCNVSIEWCTTEKRLIVFVESDGYVVVVPANLRRARRNGTKQKVHMIVRGLHVDSSRVKTEITGMVYLQGNCND